MKTIYTQLNDTLININVDIEKTNYQIQILKTPNEWIYMFITSFEHQLSISVPNTGKYIPDNSHNLKIHNIKTLTTDNKYTNFSILRVHNGWIYIKNDSYNLYDINFIPQISNTKEQEKINISSVVAKMNTQILIFKWGFNERESTNLTSRKEKDVVKLLDIELSDQSIFLDIDSCELLVLRHRKKSSKIKRESGYKFDKQVHLNNRVNIFNIDKGRNLIDLTPEYYFTNNLYAFGTGEQKNTDITGRLVKSKVKLGFKLRFKLNGKTYTTGIIGKIDMKSFKPEHHGFGIISYSE
jgi:hypothetical protein